jgi:hypothetical protein
MSDEKSSDDGKYLGGAAKAIAEVAKAVPIYPDAIQPGAKQVGRALETAGRAVNALLSPIRPLVWGVEKLEAFFERVAKKLESTPDEHRITPKQV